MIGLDTNVLARFYCDDPDDPEAKRQRPIARHLLLESGPIYIAKTVVLELEWVMRGHYGLAADAFCSVADHLLGLEHVMVEDWEQVKDAADAHRAGLGFADALHLCSSRHCDEFHTFDRRRFANRAKRQELVPRTVPH